MNYLHEYNKLIKKLSALKEVGLVDATIDKGLEKFLFNATQLYEIAFYKHESVSILVLINGVNFKLGVEKQ